MRRSLYRAAFVVLCVSMPIYAQRGGMRTAGHSPGFIAHTPLAHPSTHAFPGMHAGLGPRFSPGFGGFHRGFVRHGSRHRRCFACGGFVFPWWFAGYYDPFWGDNFYSDDYRFEEQQAREQALANEMDRLNLEEQRLRDREDALDREEAAHVPRTQVQQQVSSQPAPSTILVFQDQHRQEVQNYAIADGTLWVLTAQSAKKIPLSELDLNATQKANDERGVEFQMPR